MAQTSNIVSLEEASSLSGKSPTTIKNWINRGGDQFVVQKARRGIPWQIDFPKLLAWREEQAVLAAYGDTSKMDYEEGRRRKVAAEAALAELDLSVRRGDLVEIEVVGAEVEQAFGRCKARLLAVPGNIAAAVTGEDDPIVVQARIMDEISEALNELAVEPDGDASEETGES